MTEKAILAIKEDMALDHALVSAGDTWKLINKIIRTGYTKTAIAAGLGFKTRAVQISRDFVTVRTQWKVQQLNQRVIQCAHAIRKIARMKREGYTQKQLAGFFGFDPRPIEDKKHIATNSELASIMQAYQRLMNW